MVTITRKLIFSVGEVWFDEEPEGIPNVDVLYYRQRAAPLDGARSDEFHTRLIDLTKSHDELWAAVSKNDRYKIRRAAEKDQLSYHYWQRPDLSILDEFADFYDQFATQKGLTKVNRVQLRDRAKMGAIDVSQVKLKDEMSLTWHVHYRSQKRLRLLHSASIKNNSDTAYQSLLGRANRYHHWQDIVRFKDSGDLTYDFGGWYMGNTDQEKLGINQFKEKFGGVVVRNFNCVHSITMKGRLYLYLRKLVFGEG